jgi:hypothetical protein
LIAHLVQNKKIDTLLIYYKSGATQVVIHWMRLA